MGAVDAFFTMLTAIGCLLPESAFVMSYFNRESAAAKRELALV